LKRLEDTKHHKRRIFETYIKELGDIDEILLPGERDYVDVNWHLFPIRVNPSKRTSLFNFLRESGVGVQVNYLPAYWHPVFRDLGHSIGEFPRSDEFYSQEISLPMYSTLEKIEQEIVISILKDFFS
jgi:dTDP-4-amino-4,6-dideoxygalactose transaminase